MSSRAHDRITQDNLYQLGIKKRGMTIIVKNNDINGAISALKRIGKRESLLKDIRRHSYHITKGERGRRRKNEAIRRQRKLRLEKLESME